jgi:PAS domain S-box-containing protein
VCGSVVLWLVSLALVYSSGNAGIALVWARAAHLGVALIPVAALQLALVVLREYRRSSKALAALWLVAGIFATLGAATGWVVPAVRLYFWGFYPAYNRVGSFFVIYFVAVLAAALVLLWRGLRRMPEGTKRRRTRWLMLAYAVGYLGCVDFIAAYGIPLYPFAYLPVLGFLLVSALAIWRYHLVDITPEFAANQILATMTDALLVLDEDGIVRLANRSASKLFSRSESELIGMSLWSFLSTETFPLSVADLMAGGVINNREVTYRSDGEIRYLSLSASLMVGGRGQTVAVVCVFRDITRRRRAEQELRELNLQLEQRVAERTAQLELANRRLEAEAAERRNTIDRMRKSRDQLDTILRGVTDGIIVQNAGGELIYANDAAVALLGYPNVLALLETPAAGYAQGRPDRHGEQAVRARNAAGRGSLARQASRRSGCRVPQRERRALVEGPIDPCAR